MIRQLNLLSLKRNHQIWWYQWSGLYMKRGYAVKSSSNFDSRHDFPPNPNVNSSSSFYSHPYFNAIREGGDKGSGECKRILELANKNSLEFSIQREEEKNEYVGVKTSHPFEEAIREGAKFGSNECSKIVFMWDEPKRDAERPYRHVNQDHRNSFV